MLAVATTGERTTATRGVRGRVRSEQAALALAEAATPSSHRGLWARTLKESGHTIAEITRIVGVGRAQIYRDLEASLAFDRAAVALAVDDRH